MPKAQRKVAVSRGGTPATDGRRQRGDRSRAAVLSRAIEVASAEGLEGLTIGRLASDVGISKGNITVLFGDKVALQLATLDAAIEMFMAHVVAPASRRVSPMARLKALTRGWFSYVESRVLPGGCMIQGASSEYRAKPGAIQDHVKARRLAWMRLLAQTIQQAKAEAEIPPDTDAEQLAFELFAFQSAANVASVIGDVGTFARARKSTHTRLAALSAHRKDVPAEIASRAPRA